MSCRQTRHCVLLCLAVSGMLPALRAQQKAQDKQIPAVLRLKSFWENPLPSRVPPTDGLIKSTKDPDAVRESLRRVFGDQWINGAGSGPTLQQFDHFAELAC